MLTMKVMPKKCKTCPFRDGSPVEHLRTDIALSAMTEATRICHSTGRNNIVIKIAKNIHKKPWICRGARDIQLNMFVATGFLSEPTDKAWDAKRKELGC